MLNPRESGKFISESAKHVKIKFDGIKKLGDEIVKQINCGSLSVDNFSQNNIHPKSTDEWAIDWLFVVDSLNFCFWDLNRSWKINNQSGYFALCEAINKAMRNGIDILNPHYYSNITHEVLEEILKGDNNTTVKLLKERVDNLHEVGSVLIEKFNGSFKNVVVAANNSAVKLLDLIVENFPCYRDVAEYNGMRVSILKRAQILVGDIWACMRNERIGHFPDIHELTMFADYRVPQSLVFFGVFEYSYELLHRLSKNEIIPNGDNMEVEIRGCSIHAVEMIKDYALAKIDKGKLLNAVLIDHFLWDYRRKHNNEIIKEGIEFHKTICIYY